jgi:hypothetical protein
VYQPTPEEKERLDMRRGRDGFTPKEREQAAAAVHTILTDRDAAMPSAPEPYKARKPRALTPEQIKAMADRAERRS